ncbi:beta-1,3-galactosyltransferase brn-like [Pecten maximus]|uniref:beta-1,3-galactosyltransferase brn-like n=1 Tax=Pecten maximus TaxID=6579 RepID=UPI001458EA33|nr:beta-1,3-galactosyltransferase brn-like [Pecten maximus]
MAIRETWANSMLMRKYNFIRMFLLGNPKKVKGLSAIENENDIHKDMVLMSFHDNYYNNTLKTIGAIHWTVTHCNRSRFVVFVDDDMLVSTSRLVDFLENNATLSIFFGGFIKKHRPIRGKRLKWYVPRDDYPHDEYPPMPSAGFMIMTIDFVIDLHFASQYTKKFIYDDCYLGILAYKLHVSPVHMRRVHMRRIKDNAVYKSMIAAHGYSPSNLNLTWLALQ